MLKRCIFVLPLNTKIKNVYIVAKRVIPTNNSSEIFQSPHQIGKKVDLLVQKIQQGKKTLIITGAGVSTYSGIPDYRSGQNTIVPTGPGRWQRNQNFTPLPFQRKAILCHPNLAHFILSQLPFPLISQNVDNLHRRSGHRNLINIHGQIDEQICEKCNYRYLRGYQTKRKNGRYTGNICECGGNLQQSVILFGQAIQKQYKDRIKQLFDNCQVLLVIGSTLTIPYINSFIREYVKKDQTMFQISLTQNQFTKHSIHIRGLIGPILLNIASRLNITLRQLVQQYKIEIQKQNGLIKKFYIKDGDRLIDYIKQVKDCKYIKKRQQIILGQLSQKVQVVFYPNSQLTLSLQHTKLTRLHNNTLFLS